MHWANRKGSISFGKYHRLTCCQGRRLFTAFSVGTRRMNHIHCGPFSVTLAGHKGNRYLLSICKAALSRHRRELGTVPSICTFWNNCNPGWCSSVWERNRSVAGRRRPSFQSPLSLGRSGFVPRSPEVGSAGSVGSTGSAGVFSLQLVLFSLHPSHLDHPVGWGRLG